MIEMPEWLARLPKGARLNVDEFANALGVSRKTIESRRYYGHLDFPDCDNFGRGLRSGTKRIWNRPYWKAVTVRNYIRHLNRMELEKSK